MGFSARELWAAQHQIRELQRIVSKQAVGLEILRVAREREKVAGLSS